MDGYSEEKKLQALDELRAELAEFSPDALARLADDLDCGNVVRGAWIGCVISYKLGYPGSVRCDRRGRKSNAFTALWDNGWITDAEVRAEVLAEIERRRNTHTLTDAALEPGYVALTAHY